LEAILRRQSVVPDQAFLVVGNAEQSLAFVTVQKLSAGH
jgi:hypothetical protein